MAAGALARDNIMCPGEHGDAVAPAFGGEIRVLFGTQWTLHFLDQWPNGAARARLPSLTASRWIDRDKSSRGSPHWGREQIRRTRPTNVGS